MPRKSAIGFILLIALAITGFVWGCQTVPAVSPAEKDGKLYGTTRGAFRNRWWNYYERGLSFAEGKFYAQALADLQQAADRFGEDQRMARTYGMHFIDYFPHREMGIILYRMGNFETAKRELECSLSQFPTAKTRFYLDRVLKALIETRTPEAGPPPKLTLNVRNNEVWTREDPVILSGMAEDERFVSALSVGSTPVYTEGAAKRIPFEQRLALSQGHHVVTVQARNLMGQIRTRRVIFHVDREGPLITLEQTRSLGNPARGEVEIRGSVYDAAGLSGLTLNGRKIAIPKGTEAFFKERIQAGPEGPELAATDRLGNRTTAIIPLPTASERRAGLLVAGLASDHHRWRMAALWGPADSDPPVIQLRDWTDEQAVYLEKVYISGHVSDDHQIERLTINGVPVLRRRGQRVFFSHMAELQAGRNVITVDAEDKAGHKTRKHITVIRKIPEALQLSQRMRVSVLPFEQKGEVSAASLSYHDNLTSALVRRNRFQVVERERLDLILREQQLSRTALIGQNTALKLGRLAAAQSVITGSLIETRAGVEIVGRMVDTETGEILATEDVYDEVRDLPSLRLLAQAMALKFHRDFPLLIGQVMICKGRHIFSDMGADKIALHRRVIVFREEPVAHPVTGKMLGSDNIILGRARITQVMPEMSKARLLSEPPGTVRVKDRVITE